MTAVIILCLAIFLIATLYSSAGQAGASGYLAAMALVAEMTQLEMKAVALTLNVIVGVIGFWRFHRAGHFHWKTFWPFAACAIPMAFIGGLWHLPMAVFRPLIGAVLLFAAASLLWRTFAAGPRAESRTPRPPALPVALGAGGMLGLLAGLTGTGGGIFLSPLLILCRWAEPKRAAAVSVAFVLLNSIAGLGGVLVESPRLPSALPWYALAAVVGGFIGAGLGAGRLPSRAVAAVLGVLLTAAALRMFL